jgi:hypothetical protein
MRSSAFSAEAASPCALNSAIWLVTKSPGGSLMMKNTSAEMMSSVTAIVPERRTRKRITSGRLRGCRAPAAAPMTGTAAPTGTAGPAGEGVGIQASRPVDLSQ